MCAIDVGQDAFVWLEVRAWDARLGSTYEEVMALNRGGFGESPVFYAQGRSPFHEPPAAPAPLIGLESFSLRAAPEPSIGALLALGGGVVWWMRRTMCFQRAPHRNDEYVSLALVPSAKSISAGRPPAC